MVTLKISDSEFGRISISIDHHGEQRGVQFQVFALSLSLSPSLSPPSPLPSQSFSPLSFLLSPLLFPSPLPSLLPLSPLSPSFSLTLSLNNHLHSLLSFLISLASPTCIMCVNSCPLATHTHTHHMRTCTYMQAIYMVCVLLVRDVGVRGDMRLISSCQTG